MTAEEEIAQLKKDLAEERAKHARFEGELVRERAENGPSAVRTERASAGGVSISGTVRADGALLRWVQEASQRLVTTVWRQAPLAACQLHRLANACGLASEARQASHGRDRHLAARMAGRAMHHAAQEWRLRGAPCIPRMERDEWITHYARDPGERLCGPTSSCQGRGEQTPRAPEAERRQELAR